MRLTDQAFCGTNPSPRIPAGRNAPPPGNYARLISHQAGTGYLPGSTLPQLAQMPPLDGVHG
jgi:hypothetical protein